MLQLAFTIFLKTSDMFAESAVLVKTADVALYPVGFSVSNSVASLPAEDPVIDVVGDRQFSIAPQRFRAETAAFRENTVKRLNAGRRPVSRPAKFVPRVRFHDTIIEIGHTASYRPREYFVEAAEKRTLAAAPTPAIHKTKTDKRSFVASVIPAVKKPFGWMKAIGSKLFN
jgi:hypothetical protein